MNETKTTANLETTTPVESEQQVSPTEQSEAYEDTYKAKGKDEYDRRIERLLAENTARETGTEPPPPETLREGESWDSIYKSQPPEVQRAMAEMRKMTTQKTQELAAQRKQLEAQAQALQAQQMALQDNAAYKAIKQQAEADVGEFDPYDPQSFERYVQKQVATRLQEILEPMAQQQMKTQAQNKVQSFIAEHPELQSDNDFKAQVRETLLANDNLTLQDAYYIVKGRNASTAAQRQAHEQELFSKAAKQAGLKVGAGNNKGTTIPSNATDMRAHDLYAHLLAQKK